MSLDPTRGKWVRPARRCQKGKRKNCCELADVFLPFLRHLLFYLPSVIFWLVVEGSNSSHNIRWLSPTAKRASVQGRHERAVPKKKFSSSFSRGASGKKRPSAQASGSLAVKQSSACLSRFRFAWRSLYLLHFHDEARFASAALVLMGA